MANNPPESAAAGMNRRVWEWLTGGDEDDTLLCEGAVPDGGGLDD
jgi:hypothetical protein